MNINRSGNRYTSVGAAVSTASSAVGGTLPMGAIKIGPATSKVSQDWGYTIDPTSVTWTCVIYPQTYTVGLQDVDLDSGRAAAGKMVRHKKAIKRSISAEMPAMTLAEMSTILKAIDPRDTPTSTTNDTTTAAGMTVCFAVQYTDPWTGGTRTGVFYSGDRSVPMYNGALGLWENLPLEFVEM